MSQRLPRRVGQGHAKRMMFTGCFVAAEEALRISLVDLCAPDGTLDGPDRSIAGRAPPDDISHM